MLGKILSLFASVILLVGCSSNAPDIRAICLRDDIGNYVIKWETDPVMEGIVKMTVSDNPGSFHQRVPDHLRQHQGWRSYLHHER